ncbi:elongation factor Ts [Candidatus Roizmanbacteria bacterium]|nr:elongation factor Ts [Candidatus Roizmanbacteria bacterium]
MVNIKTLKQLRQQTCISIALCKKALEQSNNDLIKAKALLRAWGVENVKDKMQRSTSQGAIFSYVHHNKKIASIIEILSETDFVSNNDEFQKLGKELSMQIASIPTEKVQDLMNQEYIRDSSKKISDLLQEAILKFGENIKIGRFLRWELGE